VQAEYTDGSWDRSFVYGTYLDEPLMMTAQGTYDGTYYHANDLYSVAALTDATGTVIERYKYDPYGKAEVLDATGAPKTDPTYSEVGNPYHWQGGRLDQESGLNYKRYRYYDPELGRFISRWIDTDVPEPYCT